MENRGSKKRSPTGLIRNYVAGLIKNTVIRAVAVMDLVGLLLGVKGVSVLPQWFYWSVTGGAFLWANLSLYLEQARKVVELEDELAQIRGSRPSLRLYVLEDDKLRADLSVIVPTYPEKPDIEALVSQRAEELEYRPPKPRRGSLAEMASAATIWKMMRPTAEQLQRYQERINEYLDKYRRHLEQKYSYDHLVCRSREIGLGVYNRGNTPANSVVARLFFPDEVRVREATEFPEEPQEPEKPRGIWDFQWRLPVIPSVLDIYPGLRDTELWTGEADVIGPIIEPGKSTRVTYEIKKVMHNLPERSLDPLVVVFPAERSDTVYEIPYEIHCDELPEPERGALNIEVGYEREEQRDS